MSRIVVRRIKPLLNQCSSLHTNNGCLKVVNKFDLNVDKQNVEKRFINTQLQSEKLTGYLEVIKKLESAPCVDLHRIPCNILRKKKQIENLYLVDRNVAENFASMIIPDIQKKNSPILEINPGICYVTEKLLVRCDCPIYLFEKHPEFLIHINSFITKHSDRLKIIPKKLLTLSSIEYNDIIQNNEKTDGIHADNKYKYSESIYIIGAVPKVTFLYQLRYLLISGYLSTYRHAVLYLVMLPSISKIFCDTTQDPIYCSANNVMLQMIFKHEMLGTLPRCAFLPWSSNNQNRRRTKKYADNDNVLHVVKLVLNQDFFNEFTRQEAENIFLFLLTHLKRRNSYIIPALEQWVPNCGPRLIKQNYNIFTRFSELSIQQLLDLYKSFKSWPEYETCIFQNIIDRATGRK